MPHAGGKAKRDRVIQRLGSLDCFRDIGTGRLAAKASKPAGSVGG
jgi:hypothetical protein